MSRTAAPRIPAPRIPAPRNAAPRSAGHGDIAPVIAAEALLRHGLRDDEVCGYLARTWSLDDIDCGAAVRAAHVLLRREQHASLESRAPVKSVQ